MQPLCRGWRPQAVSPGKGAPARLRPNGRQLGDTTTLADASVVETIRAATGKGDEDQA